MARVCSGDSSGIGFRTRTITVQFLYVTTCGSG